jgi:hypothetical protein
VAALIGVASSMTDVLLPEKILDAAGIEAVVGQGMTTGVTEHMREHAHAEAGQGNRLNG